MYTLIRDKVPELLAKQNKICDYAIAQTDTLYAELLKNKLIESVQQFLNTNDVSELVDVQTVMDALLDLAKYPREDFQKAYDLKKEVQGDFSGKLIAFYEPAQAQPEPPEGTELPAE